jgi:hypothetical protein
LAQLIEDNSLEKAYDSVLSPLSADSSDEEFNPIDCY